jgi:N-acetylglucosaminyldiphosphoundecaprenol N-acetyl-beta-D-mannosaminyltransferase
MTAVCGGTLLLGVAGFLREKKATTHPSFMMYLKKFTENISESRVVDDGNVITAGGVTSAIDLGLYLCEKIAGIEVMEEIMKMSKKENARIYMLGAEKWVVEKARQTCSAKFGSKVAGCHDGYFNMDDCKPLVDEINGSGADILMVAMGCPRQELFIAKYREQLNCRIIMAVGGSFDVLAGKVKRAPGWMINMGIEWLYRVLKEPVRIKRLASIPRFLFIVASKR